MTKIPADTGKPKSDVKNQHPFVGKLLAWYRRHGRRLPWRGSTDPYAIWVSEVMLQQTQVETVIPYFNNWIQRFPDLHSLAAATEEEVLGIWEGLGYYSRARHLHKAARIVKLQWKGQIPKDPTLLSTLPGIGLYTANAIASIAFGLDTPALDGNIKRVFSRLMDVSLPVDTPAGDKVLRQLALVNLPKGRAGDYNQALMDLGAMICLPKKPACGTCPLKSDCSAFAQNLQDQRPVRKPRQKVPQVIVTAAVIKRGGKYLLARRPPHGLLGGMWEFPGGKLEEGESLEECLRREIREELDASVNVGEEVGIFKHAYTHFRVTVHAFACTLGNEKPTALEATELAWVLPEAFDRYPMGKVDRLIALQVQHGR
jgi:A/G-specific adenine glycosylase